MNLLYDRRADESEGWYERFHLWLFMGSKCSLAEVHEYATKLAEGMMGGESGEALPTDFESWQRAAEIYGWRERLLAYEQLMTKRAETNTETNTDINVEINVGDPEAEGMRMVTTLLRQVNQALQQADLFHLSREEARAVLPTLRLFFKDLFHLHREALQVVAASSGGEGEGVAWSADELLKAFEKMGGLQQLLVEMRRVTDPAVGEAAWQPLRDLLAQLYQDEASARRIVDQAQLDGTRIHFAARALDRWHAILTEASHAGYVEKVIAVALAEYPHNSDLEKAALHYRRTVGSTMEAQGQQGSSGAKSCKRTSHKHAYKKGTHSAQKMGMK